MRYRGVAYPFPLAHVVLDALAGERGAAAWVYWYNEIRGAEHNIPSIFG